MGRSRSRSPPGRRERHRSRSRERERDHDRRVRGRYRSRSPSPRRRRSSRSPPIRRRSRSRSWSPPRNRRSRSSSRIIELNFKGNIELEQKGTSENQNRGRDSNREAPKRAVSKFLMERTPITEKDLEGKTDEEKEMMKLMGFGNFDTTKGKHVAGNVAYGTHVIQKRKYRQYMNRKGGFNRPLDFVA